MIWIRRSEVFHRRDAERAEKKLNINAFVGAALAANFRSGVTHSRLKPLLQFTALIFSLRTLRLCGEKVLFD